MSLVPYPDSDQEDETIDHEPNVQPGRNSKAGVSVTRAVKRKRSTELPPLPAAFHDLYAVNARVSTSDDPSLHGGRKRATPHIEGNWPSHVYLEWIPSQAESQSLYDLIDRVKATIENNNDVRNTPSVLPDIVPSLLSLLGTPLPLHISLSRTLQIKTDAREAFLDSLTVSLRKSMVKPFALHFSRLKWVPNFERNRWFLVLVSQRPPQDELNRLLDSCNHAARQAGYPGLYVGGRGDGPMQRETSSGQSENPTRKSYEKPPTNGLDRTEYFHVSIAWNLAEPDPAFIKLVDDFDVSEHVTSLEPAFDTVKVKVGNTVHSIDLASKKAGLGTKSGLLGLG